MTTPKIEINGNEIRIKGPALGETRHLIVHCHSDGYTDTYSFEIHKDGIAGSGDIPTIHMDKNNTIKESLGGIKEFI